MLSFDAKVLVCINIGRMWIAMLVVCLNYVHNRIFVFFFQAEDGIRDDLVTGVQTCALPISII